tara:strand:+ start:310 stop:636 length:327 start_codon:yes stop_codon:yes gene_type:complete
MWTLVGFGVGPKRMDFLMSNEPKTRLIIFSADWCLPCKVARKEMRENDSLKEMLENYEVVLYNFDIAIPARRKYNVTKVPTYIIEKDGVEIRRKIGFGGTARFKKFLN